MIAVGMRVRVDPPRETFTPWLGIVEDLIDCCSVWVVGDDGREQEVPISWLVPIRKGGS